MSVPLNTYNITFGLPYSVITTTVFASCEDSARENATWMLADDWKIDRALFDNAEFCDIELIEEDI